MLTVLHIIESLVGYGGTPRMLLYLTRHLDPSTCRQIYLCYRPSALKEEFERYGAIVECIKGASFAAIIRKAVHLVRRYGVSIICTHSTRALVTGYVTARAAGLPMIHCEHSSAQYRQGLGRLLTRLILPRVELVTCNSRYTLESVRTAFDVPPGKLVALHCPVEERRCEMAREDIRAELGLSPEDSLIGHMGGMIPQRDQVSLIRAFSLVRLTHPNVRLVIIGDGPLRSELESLVVRLDLCDYVAFTGYIKRIGDYLRAMDIYVNPTLDEGFGIAVVEAMLARLPVVLANLGAHPELIEDGISGLLYRGNDTDCLARSIRQLTDNPAQRASMGAAARGRAVSLFDPKRYAEAFFMHAKATVEVFTRSHYER